MQSSGNSVLNVTSVESDEVELRAIFCDYGLSDAEAMVFAILVRLGSKQASAIAKFSGISRAHVYGILDRLKQRTLISSCDRDGVQHFSAIPMKQLIATLASKESLLASRRKQLEQLSTKFRAPEQDFWNEPLIHCTRGVEARAVLFKELSAVVEEPRYLFFSLTSSVLFENHPPSVSAIAHLQHLGGESLRLIAFGSTTLSEELSEIQALGTIEYHAESFPAECLLSKNSISIFGMKGTSSRTISIEQRIIAQMFYSLVDSMAFGPRRGAATSRSKELRVSHSQNEEGERINTLQHENAPEISEDRTPEHIRGVCLNLAK